MQLRSPLVLAAYAVKPRKPLPRRWRGLVGYGRLDILVRFILASVYPMGSCDPHVQVVAVLNRGGRVETILFDCNCLPQEAVYEHDVGPSVLSALRGEGGCGRAEFGSIEEFIALLKSWRYRVVVLRENGRPYSGYSPYTVYVTGLRDDPPTGIGEDSIESIGPKSYLASHVAAFIRLSTSIPLHRLGDDG